MRKVKLPARFKANGLEHDFVAKYMRLEGSTYPTFVVDNQSFHVGVEQSKEEATWMCWMFAKAALAMIDKEQR